MGLAFESPTWYRLNDELSQNIAAVSSNTGGSLPEDVVNPRVTNYYEPYKLQTPSKLTASMSYIFGKSGLISFDYSVGNELNGDVFVSVERVKDNAQEFSTVFDEELKRVIIHGILHYCGYKDKSAEDELLMRKKEDEKIKMFHVEQ